MDVNEAMKREKLAKQFKVGKTAEQIKEENPYWNSDLIDTMAAEIQEENRLGQIFLKGFMEYDVYGRSK